MTAVQAGYLFNRYSEPEPGADHTCLESALIVVIELCYDPAGQHFVHPVFHDVGAANGHVLPGGFRLEEFRSCYAGSGERASAAPAGRSPGLMMAFHYRTAAAVGVLLTDDPTSDLALRWKTRLA